ncbi:TPA: hypothetical protein ACGX64_001166 [Listeria monocytogenes]|uniref:DUF2577 domain-containing protein n=3 Tax=Listeriaceae TaxID=186820 RepID=A0A5Y9DIP3_LISMN|nr:MULTISPECIES: hypothetical protein [Listeria]EAD0692796.1 hypothetical protein [Listeria monocytogenes]EAE9977150.1 hypothetical protein [Listeria monocytogenes]EAE9987778.1 hypothetical protein [Listeria monocytogenes]EAE9989464.1 hypothetical protein [Listeria monocytogenes]EAE9991967.1 hypothetical protein [Listeria monocytogenes]
MKKQIQSIVKGVLNSEVLADFVPGEILNIAPLSVKINDNDKLILSGEQVQITEGFMERGPVEGDRVLCARLKGGQLFVVLDRLI